MITTEINNLSKKGLYGEAVLSLIQASKKKGENLSFSIKKDLDDWVSEWICAKTSVDCCTEPGTGCCCVIALIAGLTCSACPAWYSECSNEFFDICICDTGKGIWEACCCCYW